MEIFDGVKRFFDDPKWSLGCLWIIIELNWSNYTNVAH
jgi:hypothetical protein